MLCRETRPVNGREVGCLKLRFAVNGQPVVLYLYWFGGLVGRVQVRTCAGTASFDGCEPDFTELLNGLEIHKPKHPRLKRMTQGLSSAAKVTIGAVSVIGVALFRFILRAQWQTALLLTGILTVGVFLAGWIYDLVKYPLE